jgi:hypothetical protein
MNAELGKSFSTHESDAAADALMGEFWEMCLRGAPRLTLFFLRFCRSIAVFFAVWGLMSVQPYHPNGHFLVAVSVALLSFTNLTKWLAATTIAFLLIITLVPKSVFAIIARAIAG